MIDTDANPFPFFIPDEKQAIAAGTQISLPLESSTELEKFPALKVLKLEYLKTLNLLAVCSVKEGDANYAYISLHEPNSLELKINLPPLCAWPYLKQSDHLSSVRDWDISCDNGMLSVKLKYADDFSKQDLFLFQLI